MNYKNVNGEATVPIGYFELKHEGKIIKIHRSFFIKTKIVFCSMFYIFSSEILMARAINQRGSPCLFLAV